MELNTLLTELAERKGSDLHLVAGQPPVFRIDGALVRREGEAMEEEALTALLLSPLSEDQKTRLISDRQDVEISLRREGRSYRYHLYYERGRLACAIRSVPQNPPSLEMLYPDADGIRGTLEALTELPRGLVLMTGPTGCGRNTTCAALLERINQSMSRRILTLEDPIEYEMVSKQSLITQRSIGQDVASFRLGALSAFREDVDVVLISELRDLETIQYALALAESGHLVLSTLHLERATDAVRRIIEVFPEPRDLIRRTVARNLAAVIAQRLLPRADKSGRVPVNEVLLGTPQMRRMIAENAADLTLGIEAGRDAGMQTMDDSILRCYRQGILSYETAWTYIEDHERLGPYAEAAPKSM
jgi:twitching motility protein PilT